MSICECGCGISIPEINKLGKFARFKHGHNIRLDNPNKNGHTAWNKGLTKEIDIRMMSISEKLTGRTPSDETREKLKQASLGNKSHLGHRQPKEAKLKIRLARRNQIMLPHSEKTKQKIGIGNKGIPKPGKENAIKGAAKISEKKRKAWQNPEFAKKMFLSQKLQPNKPELYLQIILNETYPNEWIYVGDGKVEEVIIGGKCPDFWNGNHKFIEHFGDFWHRGENPQIRIDHFHKYGYDCLVIWEHELKDKNKVIRKIISFAS